MLPTLYCLADSREHAEALVAQLQSAGVLSEHVSALATSDDPQHHPASLAGTDSTQDTSTTDPAKAAAGATTGTAAGAAAGVAVMGIVGLTPLLILAPLVVTGGALAGAAAGAVAGATGSRLADYGVPEERREAYEQKLTAGGVLVAVSTEDEAELEKANAALEKGGAKDVGLFRLTKRVS